MSISRRHQFESRPEIIAVLKPEVGVLDYEAPPRLGVDPKADDLLSLLTRHKAKIKPVLRERPGGKISAVGAVPPGESVETSEARRQLKKFHSISVDADQVEELRSILAKHPAVETAYIKPPSGPPEVRVMASADVAPDIGAGLAVTGTPDFTGRQDYLKPAPTGIDADYAWAMPGGKGAGINIIDCEWAWNFTHEDLAAQCNGVKVGTVVTADDDHGTSVLGIMIANDNGFGTTGVAPQATVATAAFDDTSDTPTSTIISQAADLLVPGDILLLEIQRQGPNTPAGSQPGPNSDHGYIAIEWWPDDFQAIKYAVSKGILVVEAAGNGSQNLDDPLYNTPSPGFPADWKNPFGAGGPDSGAIVVGAGNPPAGTHGRTQDTIGYNETYVDRARCIFSNFGSRVDCQGWGWEVTTLGGGDLSGVDHNSLYTDVFAGTSSASPIITGVLACAQGVLQARGQARLTPAAARQLMRTTGSPQQDAPGRPASQRIGSRPDLQQMLKILFP
jgi:hypothetical protein